MSAIWLIFLLSLAVLAIVKYWRGAEIPIFLIGAAAALILTGFVWLLSGFLSETVDKELWNGEISAKENVIRDCPRGWNTTTDSFCTEYRTRSVYDGESCSGSGKDRTCTSQYHTEYKYIYSWEGRWYLFAENLNKKLWEIKRIDRQGANEPPFWTSVNVGDPASIPHNYTNWLRGSAESVFHEDGEAAERYKALIPEYPIKLYDIFKVDRIVTVGVTIPDIQKLNHKLSEALKTLGPKRQMNAVIVVVDAKKAPSADYAYAVRRAWKGFKKNDAVTFIGVSDGNIAWAEVLSWSKKSIFNIELRDKILENRNKPLDLNNVISYIETIGLQSYERRSMKEFEFLKEELTTPLWVIISTLIVNALAIFLVIILTSTKRNYYVR